MLILMLNRNLYSITDHKANRVALPSNFKISEEYCHRLHMSQHEKESHISITSKILISGKILLSNISILRIMIVKDNKSSHQQSKG